MGPVVETQYNAKPEKAFDAIMDLSARMLSEQWWMVSTIEYWPEPLRYWFDKRSASMHRTGSEEETPLPCRHEPYQDLESPRITRFPEKSAHLCWNFEEGLDVRRTMYAYLPYTRE